MTSTPALFDFLDRSHQELQRQLVALRRLVGAVADDTLDAAGRDELKRTIAWFNREARQHHLDEEHHVFPPLLQSTDANVVQTTLRLRQDHGWIEENWLELEPSLEAAAGGYSWFDRDTLAQGVEVFEQLYIDHLTLEESLAYPEARARIDPTTLARASAEMAQRRAQREARPAKR
ncbi:MAG TPA: hemerythrin domain-containing protein [Rubrivivax sp.]|jgi:iron-sulfur cluster repair protein YtfE (RIC family)|nr:hemerythrin domain-containing protein [Rubrivivax sp.]